MIAKLRGLVDQCGDGWAVIDVHGVGYLVFCPDRTLHTLVVGEEATLAVETHVREDRLQLFGFTDRLEREWFRILQTVQGVGSRLALAILSALSPDDLAQALAAGDQLALTRAEGVGARVAARLITDLKGKAGVLALSFENNVQAAAPVPAASATPARAGATPAARSRAAKADSAARLRAAQAESVARLRAAQADAVSALVTLGYERSEAFAAVARATPQAAEDEGGAATVESLVRRGLQALARDVAPREILR